jgi:general nucleoside transport system permease protein
MKRSIGFSLIGLTAGFLIAGLLVGILGEDPIFVFQILLNGAFGSLNNLAYSLYYATPLILTGLAVSWAFQSGLFNIGAEGQMAVGGLAMVTIGLVFQNLPWPLSILFALFAAFLAGGFWGAIAGWLKAYRKVHEVLGTIMLNFIAYGIVGYIVSEIFRNPQSQVPETLSLDEKFRVPVFVNDPLNFSILLALIAAAVVATLLWRTRFGFHQRMAGGSRDVGVLAGINMNRQTVISMFISGGLAGLAATSDILGFSLKLREGFTGGSGFIGIAVALLGRNHPAGIILSALLFGALHKGSLDLDLDTDRISRDLSVVIQAIVIIMVASQKGIQDLSRKWRQERV